MLQVIYILSTLYLLITALLLKKSDEKINFLKSFTISIVIFMCYNIVISFIYNTIYVPITLLTLSIPNIIIGSILLFLIIKKKNIQKYSINKKNIIMVILLILIISAITFIKVGQDFNINYMMTDSAYHFAAARELYQNTTLVDKIENDTVGGQFMSGAYINTGILFKVIEPITGEIHLYKVFILFDVFLLFIISILIYTSVEKYIKTKLNFVISIFMIAFFIIGYPLNSLASGYVYLQLGIVIIASTINILQHYTEGFNRKIIYVLLLLFNFGLFFSYIIFTPIVFIAEFIYLIITRYKESKKIFTLKNIAIISEIFIIPALCGVYYFVIPHILNYQDGGDLFINLEGYIYRNCWSNFIFILPMSLMCIRKGDNNSKIWGIFTGVLVTCMVTYLLVLLKFNLATYYYFKFNFILWLLLWYGALYAVNTTENKKRIFIIVYALVYMIIGIIVFNIKQVPVTKELFDKDENITNVYDIYGINKVMFIEKEADYTKEELEILKFIFDNVKLDMKDNNILLIADPMQECWFDGIFNYRNRNNLQSFIPESEVDKWNNKEYKYILILYRSFYYEKYKDIINKGSLLYSNDYGAIYVNE